MKNWRCQSRYGELENYNAATESAHTCHSPLIQPEASLLLPCASQISTPSFKQILTATPSGQIGVLPPCLADF